MQFINLTPHDVKFRGVDGVERVFPASNTTARVETTSAEAPPLDGMPCQRTEFGKIVGLPNGGEGTVYIVSLIVLNHPDCKGRNDVIAPATGPNDKADRWQLGDTYIDDRGIEQLVPSHWAGLIRAVTHWVRPS